MEKIIRVEGMTCGHCKASVEEALSKLDFVDQVEVDLASKEVRIQGAGLDEKLIKDTIEDIGFDVE